MPERLSYTEIASLLAPGIRLQAACTAAGNPAEVSTSLRNPHRSCGHEKSRPHGGRGFAL